MSWTSSAPRTLLIEDRITHDTAWLFGAMAKHVPPWTTAPTEAQWSLSGTTRSPPMLRNWIETSAGVVPTLVTTALQNR